MGETRFCAARGKYFFHFVLKAMVFVLSLFSLPTCNSDSHICILQVIAEHSRQGYMATSVFPLAKDYLNGQKLPGDIKPEEWDGFHDLIVIDEVARCGYLGVIWALTCGNSIGAPPLVNFGNEDQKRQFLPSILNGTTRFCLAVTEPDGTS